MAIDLFAAIRKGDVAALKKKGRSPLPVHTKNKQGLTPLMMAAARGQAAMVLLLLKQGAEVNFFEQTMGMTALHFACQHGDVPTIEALLSAGALVNVQTSCNGMTPLMSAVTHRQVGAVLLLLEQPTLNLTLKMHAGQTVQQLVSDMLLSGQGTKQCPTPKVVKQLQNIQAVISARSALVDSVPLVAALATQGSDLEQHQQYLHKYLQQLDDINQPFPCQGSGYDLCTALHIAAGDGLVNICQVLLDAGAEIAVKEAYGHETPVHKAAYYGHASVLSLLATHADFPQVVNVQNPVNGYTALHYAVWQGCFAAAKVLLQHGADPTCVGFDGRTPQDLATMNDAYDLEELFVPALV